MILLGVYFLIKLQGWNYGFRAMNLEKQLEHLRPTLSAIVLSEQLESTRAGLTQVLDKIGGLGLQGGPFLQQLSKNLPAEITLEKMEVSAEGLQIHGTLRPGAHTAEETLALWAKQLEENWHSVQVQELVPDPKTQEVWHFQLKARRVSDVS